MKNKYILLIATLLVCSISVWGQTKKSTSANSTKAIAEKVQMLETNTQEQFSQLQNENKALKEQLQKIENEIALYREDVRTETSRMSTYMALWFAALTLVIGGITAALGVAAPLILNNKNDKISNYIKTSIKTLKGYLPYIKNTLSNPYHNGFVEGNNNFIKVIKRIAFGFRSFHRFKARIS